MVMIKVILILNIKWFLAAKCLRTHALWHSFNLQSYIYYIKTFCDVFMKPTSWKREHIQTCFLYSRHMKSFISVCVCVCVHVYHQCLICTMLEKYKVLFISGSSLYKWWILPWSMLYNGCTIWLTVKYNHNYSCVIIVRSHCSLEESWKFE